MQCAFLPQSKALIWKFLSHSYIHFFSALNMNFNISTAFCFR